MRIAGWASTAASGRCTTAITPTTSLPRSRAMPRSWMSTIAISAPPLSSSFSASVDAVGLRIVSSTPSASSKPRSTAR